MPPAAVALVFSLCKSSIYGLSIYPFYLHSFRGVSTIQTAPTGGLIQRSSVGGLIFFSLPQLCEGVAVLFVCSFPSSLLHLFNSCPSICRRLPLLLQSHALLLSPFCECWVYYADIPNIFSRLFSFPPFLMQAKAHANDKASKQQNFEGETMTDREGHRLYVQLCIYFSPMLIIIRTIIFFIYLVFIIRRRSVRIKLHSSCGEQSNQTCMCTEFVVVFFLSVHLFLLISFVLFYSL